MTGSKIPDSLLHSAGFYVLGIQTSVFLILGAKIHNKLYLNKNFNKVFMDKYRKYPFFTHKLNASTFSLYDKTLAVSYTGFNVYRAYVQIESIHP